LLLHLAGSGLDEAEHAIEVDGEGGAPLSIGHRSDGGVLGLPDAVVGDENVDAAEVIDGAADEGPAVFRGRKILGEGYALGWAAAFGDELFGSGLSGTVVEGDASSSLAEEADRGRADATGASGDEGDFVFEGERDTGHGTSVSMCG